MYLIRYVPTSPAQLILRYMFRRLAGLVEAHVAWAPEVLQVEAGGGADLG